MFSRNQNWLALIRISLDSETPTGKKPTYEELAAYCEDRLTTRRKTEIKRWIARDQSVFSDYLLASEAIGNPLPQEDTSKTHQRTNWSKRLRVWLDSLLPVPPMHAGAMAGVAVALILSVLILPQLTTISHERLIAEGFDQLEDFSVYPGHGFPEVYRTKSLDNLFKPKDIEQEVAKLAFQSGVWYAISHSPELPINSNLLDLSKTLQKELPSCEIKGIVKERCNEISNSSFSLGRWTTLANATCQISSSDGTTSELTETVIKAHKLLIQEINILSISPWNEQLDQKKYSDNLDAYCEAAKQYLSAAL